MEVFLGIFVALSYIAAVIFVRQMTTLIHEMGHAIPAMLFNQTDKPVQVFIGSYGNIKDAIQLNFSDLQLFIKPKFLDWKLGMCKSPPTNDVKKDIIVTLGGPIASTLVASIFLFLMIKGGWSDGWITFAAICMTSALIDLFVNLYPQGQPIAFYDNSIGYSDGYWLKIYFSRLRMSSDYFDLEESFSNKDYDDVITRGHALISNSEQQKEVYQLVLAALLKKNDYEAAIDFYHELHARFPIDDRDHFILSELMLNVNDTDEALQHINVFLHKNHNDIEGLNRRGHIFLKKSEFKEAYLDLSHAHRMNPYHAQVNSNLGLYHLKQRELAEAEAFLNIGIKNNPKCGLCWFNKGLWNEEKWRWSEALECFENAKKFGYVFHGLEMKIAEMDNLSNHD
ncbi:MAG: hypothetical protein AB8G22_02010 [Saprospiraceae bacterium]